MPIPEQPVGCEDLGEENNAVDRFLVGLWGVARVRREYTPRGNCAGSGGDCKGVAPLVLRMSRVALDPMEGDAVGGKKGVQPHPEVGIFLFGEAFGLPGREPAVVDGVHDV